MLKENRVWSRLKAISEIVLHHQSHWWVIPGSVLLYGMVTAVQIVSLQTESYSLGVASVLLFSDGNFRCYIINPIYLFIIANIGGQHQQYEALILHRLGSRQWLWCGKLAVLIALSVGYLAVVIASAEIAAIPFVNYEGTGWDEVIKNLYRNLSFVDANTPLVIWASTFWFVLLSWFALGGTAFVLMQITGRAGIGFFVAILLNLSGFFTDIIDPAFTSLYMLDIRQPMLFFWYGEPTLSFSTATTYWGIWYIVLLSTVLGYIEYTSGLISHFWQKWVRGAGLIIHTSLGRLWLIAILFAVISAVAEVQGTGIDVDTLGLVNIRLNPIASLGGPFLGYPVFSFVFLRWLLIFLIFLFLISETAVHTLWRQHVMLLPRLGSRVHWWFSNVLAIACLSLVYLSIYSGIHWLIFPKSVELNELLFYCQIFILYWLTLIWLGSGQLLLLLLTRSRVQTMLVLGLLFTAVWSFANNQPILLPWLPVAQTAILANLAHVGTIYSAGLLSSALIFLITNIGFGLFVIHHYEFTTSLKHN